MENDAMPETHKKDKRENLVIPLAILIFLLLAWLVYVYENRIWLTAFQQSISWLANPKINYTPAQIEGIPLAFLATIEILVLGFLASYTLLANEKDALIKFISALGLGFGFTALITIILGILGNLFQLPLNVAIMLLCAGFLLVNVYKQKGKEKPSIQEFLKAHFNIRKIRKPANFKLWLLACSAIGIVFLFCFYNALSTIIMHWDATVYHAVMPVIMYENHAIPVIAGPSIGIEMSANFPPLFSALGAFYYVQIGLIEDFYLRAIPPVMGILTLLATYKIGEFLAGKKYGIIAALFLAITPLFFRYSMYATSYSTLTFFGTISVLFLFLAIIKEDKRYWIMCGIFYGFALLTSYLAMYLAPFLVIALIYYFMKERAHFKVSMKNALLLVLSALVIGGVWYLRNWVLVGNPVYPNGYTLLGGINIDPLIMQTTVNGIKWSATTSLFGGEIPLLEKIFVIITYRTHFPAISLLTILGIAILPTQNRKLWLVLAWPLTLIVFILSGVTWGFPRHIVFAMPGFALLSALPISKALEKCEKYDRNIMHHSKNAFSQMRKRMPSLHKSDLLRIGMVIGLILALLFPSLTLSMGGKTFMENRYYNPPNNYLWFLENPNAETWAALNVSYPEAVAWNWLNEHLTEGEKVATVENRIYYVKNCSNEYFFYLDGWEARELYNITDPAAILQYLHNKNVKYVLDVMWAREHGHFDILPMTQFLRPPYFLKVMNRGGNPDIYEVGPIETPITADSPVMLSINQEGWSEPQLINGVTAQSVIAGSVLPRLYVDASNLTSVKITYLDNGTGMVSINLYDPYSQRTIFDYATIQKSNTNEWKTSQFLVPLSEKGFVEFAPHAYNESFTISRIEAVPFQAKGKVPLQFLETEITNATFPPTLMVYLPMLYYNETVMVQADSFGKDISLEVFEGVIQPWETTSWWEHHELVARSPSLPTYGQANPSMVWKTKDSGLYTMVISLRDEYSQDAKVDLHMSIGGTR
jgi:hypothetical protein